MDKNKKVTGNIDGVRRVDLEKLEGIFDISEKDFCAPGILQLMLEFTAGYGREIAVGISRSGAVNFVTIGTNSAASFKTDSRRKGLCGIRVIHTHPSGAELSNADISALTANRLDSIACASADGPEYEAAFLFGDGIVRVKPDSLSDDSLTERILEADKYSRTEVAGTKRERERAILAGVNSESELLSGMQELRLLAETAGADVVGEITQHKSDNKVTLIGTGKLEELILKCQVLDADVVIFDNELSGIQIKNLELALNIKVIDRSELILDIFAGRATSTEGRLQVELAQLKYNLPRLIGRGSGMDKMRHGIGMRGPGEKKLELDRRIIREQVQVLEKRLQKLESERALRRSQRIANKAKTVALVGYTNAGKSSVMNALSRADVFVKDMLFATLDPVTRRVRTAGGNNYLLTDTVGFINKLPHEFIKAFRSTLEEARNADIILHVMDASNPELFKQHEVVMDVLSKLDIFGSKIISVYNKSDLLIERPALPATDDFLYTSAVTGDGIHELKEKIAFFLFGETSENTAPDDTIQESESP